MKEMSDLFCGKAAVGGNYNSTRDSNELDKKKNELEIAFNIPVYVLGYSIEDICDRLISHLSE